MKMSRELRYDAPPDQVYAMLADPAFREKVAQEQDVAAVTVTVTPTGAGMTLVNDQQQNTAGLPAIAKKIVGDTTRAIITETWADATSATVVIDVPGKPTSASGTIRLAAAGGGTVETVELDIKVKVPVIGGKLEGVMKEQILEGYDVEHRVGTAWLAGER